MSELKADAQGSGVPHAGHYLVSPRRWSTGQRDNRPAPINFKWLTDALRCAGVGDLRGHAPAAGGSTGRKLLCRAVLGVCWLQVAGRAGGACQNMFLIITKKASAGAWR
jgi:hypothetical protein